MVPIHKSDDRGATRVFTCDLHRIFGRFGAGREQQRLLGRSSERTAVQFFGNADVRLVHRDLKAGVGESRGLLGDCRDDVGMSVPGIEGRDTADKIDVPPSLDVENYRAACALDPDWMGSRDAARNARLTPLRKRCAIGNGWFFSDSHVRRGSLTRRV